jgi:hypothetical protein
MRHPFSIEPPLSPLQKEKNQLFSPCGEEKILHELPQETSFGHTAAHGPTHWHAVEPAYCRSMSSVTIRSQR